jgi:hypothetical protein
VFDAGRAGRLSEASSPVYRFVDRRAAGPLFRLLHRETRSAYSKRAWVTRLRFFIITLLPAYGLIQWLVNGTRVLRGDRAYASFNDCRPMPWDAGTSSLLPFLCCSWIFDSSFYPTDREALPCAEWSDKHKNRLKIAIAPFRTASERHAADIQVFFMVLCLLLASMVVIFRLLEVLCAWKTKRALLHLNVFVSGSINRDDNVRRARRNQVLAALVLFLYVVFLVLDHRIDQANEAVLARDTTLLRCTTSTVPGHTPFDFWTADGQNIPMDTIDPVLSSTGGVDWLMRGKAIFMSLWVVFGVWRVVLRHFVSFQTILSADVLLTDPEGVSSACPHAAVISEEEVRAALANLRVTARENASRLFPRPADREAFEKRSFAYYGFTALAYSYPPAVWAAVAEAKGDFEAARRFSAMLETQLSGGLLR